MSLELGGMELERATCTFEKNPQRNVYFYIECECNEKSTKVSIEPNRKGNRHMKCSGQEPPSKITEIEILLIIKSIIIVQSIITYNGVDQ